MKQNLASIWETMEQDCIRKPVKAERLYRALGDSAIGIRAGYLPDQQILELLIEVPFGWSGATVIPEWHGMRNEIVELRLPPRENARHLRLYVESPEHRDVFLILCEELVAAIEDIPEATLRMREIETCLLRWRRFFERYGPEGLPLDMQQGLFAELSFLHKILISGLPPPKAISAWKGCEMNYHDFDFGGQIVEVKSTRTKEPRNILINNERQLDERGLESLHLFVMAVQIVDGGGTTLTERVDSLRSLLANTPSSLQDFESKLSKAGFFDRDSKKYKKHIVVKTEDFYRVVEGFPRIIDPPPGIGNLKYNLFLSACEAFREDIDRYISELKGF